MNHQRAPGAAMVEMAIITTAFLLIVLGIVEFGNAFMVKQAVVSAARDGARKAAVTPNLPANSPEVAKVVFDRLRPVGITTATVTNNAATKAGDEVTVRVQCQYNLLTKVDWFRMLQGMTFAGEAILYYEG